MMEMVNEKRIMLLTSAKWSAMSIPAFSHAFFTTHGTGLVGCARVINNCIEYLVDSNKCITFAAWFRNESPGKVRLAAINWELGCESPTVPQQWTPLWPEAGKPLPVWMRRRFAVEGSLKTSLFRKICRSPRWKGRRRKQTSWDELTKGELSFYWRMSEYVYYYISLEKGRPVERQRHPFVVSQGFSWRQNKKWSNLNFF